MRPTEHRTYNEADPVGRTMPVGGIEPTMDGSGRPINTRPGGAFNAPRPPAPASERRNPIVPAPPMLKAPTPAQTIGRYRIVRELGRGGMGAVYEAFDEATGRTVALKVVLGGKANPRQLARFQLESRVTAMLEHPSIVPVHDIGKESDRLFLVMKLVRGKTFKDLVLKGRGEERSLPRLLDHFRKLCEAVAFMHAKGVIHRDLKPDNILAGEHGETILLDFGIVKIVGEPDTSADDVATLDKIEQALPHLTMTGSILGTPSFMSPEQARGQIDQLDTRTDVYALGAILYFLLTATPPFMGKTADAILKAVRAGHLKPPHQIEPRTPPELESVTLRAMNPTQSRRYAGASELRLDIERYLAGECPQAHKDSYLAAALRSVQRHPARSAGLAAATVAILSAGTAASLINAAGSERQRAEISAQAERSEKEQAALRAEQAAMRAVQARQRELLATGKADDLARELGVTVKTERDAAVDELIRYVETEMKRGVDTQDALRKLTNAQLESFMYGLGRTLETEKRTGIKLVVARDYYYLGVIYLWCFGNAERAEVAAKLAQQRDPDLWSVWSLLGYIAQERKQWVELERIWRKVLTMPDGKDFPDALAGVAAGLYSQQRFVEALPYFKRYLAVVPNKNSPSLQQVRKCMEYCESVAKQK